MLTRAKVLPPDDVSVMALQPQLFHWDVILVKLVIVAHVGHVSMMNGGRPASKNPSIYGAFVELI